jgi:hypothetical protein
LQVVELPFGPFFFLSQWNECLCTRLSILLWSGILLLSGCKLLQFVELAFGQLSF